MAALLVGYLVDAETLNILINVHVVLSNYLFGLLIEWVFNFKGWIGHGRSNIINDADL